MEFFDSVGRVVKVPDDDREGRKQTVVRRVTRPSLVELCHETGVPTHRITRDNVVSFYKTTSNPMLNEALFARYVILGEGDTEELALPVYLSAQGVDCDLLGISIIGVKGKSQIPKYWRLLTAFEIPVLALADNDNDGTKDKMQSNELLASCFGYELDELLTVSVCRRLRRPSPPDGALVLLEKDFEAAVRASYATFDSEDSERIARLESDALDKLGPRANKGLVARYVARRIVEDKPDFCPDFIKLILEELRSAGLVKTIPGTEDDAEEEQEDDDDFSF